MVKKGKMKLYQDLLVDGRPFIIAEIGVNFYDIAVKENISNIDAAKLMIDKAKESGVDAVKFQSYKAEKLASKNSPSYWDRKEEPTSSQYELFKKFDNFGADDYKEIAVYCLEKDVMFLSTPFDFESADYLEKLMPLYKISSSDITNIPFIRYIAEKKKPVFISTGASTLGEIETAINTILKTGNNEICLMHCVLDYPTSYDNANLEMIKHLKTVFPNMLYGYSDHTRPDESMTVLSTAFLYGAQVLEKHFTLDKTLKGNDHYHAMDHNDLSLTRRNLNLIEKINGQYIKEPLECETQSRLNARRSIVLTQSMSSGEVISRDKLEFKRPGVGISPADMEKVLGRKVQRDMEKDDILKWVDI